MGGEVTSDKPIRNATIPHRESPVMIYHSVSFPVGIYPSFPGKPLRLEQKAMNDNEVSFCPALTRPEHGVTLERDAMTGASGCDL